MAVTSAQDPAQGLLDQGLRVDVEGGQRVVEDQHGRPGQHRARERQALALAAGQAHALLADPRVEAPRQLVHEAGLRHVERLGDLPGVASGWPRVRFSRTDIENSVGSSNAVATTERRESRVRLADVVPVDGDRPGRDVVQARHEAGEDGLARPGGADDRDGLARGQVEVDVVQDVVPAVGEPEADAAEPQRPPRVDQLQAAVGHAGLGVEHLGDPVGGGHRLLGHREQEAQRGDRPHEREHQRDEGDQRAHGQPALAGGDRAEAAAR